MCCVPIWQPGAQDAENDAFLTRPTPARRDALFLRRRSQLARILNGDPAASPLGGAHRRGAPYSSHRAPQRVRLRFLLRLRPCWDVILSILRDSELFDAERLFACVLGSEPDEVRVIPLGSYLHTVFKNLAPTQDPKSRFF
jgi:hypothetical protein